MAKTRNFAEVIKRKLQADPGLADQVDQETTQANIAALIYRAHEQAGLTQAQLAERVCTHQPVIARLENADYDGHSLLLLRRIAAAIGKRLKIDFEDVPACEQLVSDAPAFTERERMEWTTARAWRFIAGTHTHKSVS